ncbi:MULTISPECIES: glycine--tRNA ligase [unclassified Imperialibacter]|uniref:glycine--tRNA ligase n=1 Tax=unclassified Imperialibacter TaxID=2629706 RepID=UPI0012515178|nr:MULTISPECIES: glycine--tRNA ligase [unclassified Imperialibacter]CAD5271549.1 Glycine--tRNA ligase [Imperialibacter sp. 89]CAD5298896.1 Glycine--tRNA ligase [Imperialibacter sp. 75]VVT35094.1 Glycine--tRNA ligase [Imperialibacter sp. EC-SDR9]
MNPKDAPKEETSLLRTLIAHAKEYGFIYPSSEIYDGLQAVYDYGAYGVELKNNIKKVWWESMTRLNENIVGIDAAIFMHPTTWKASGHVDGFNDPMIDNKDSKKRYRADNLIEDKATEYENNGDTEKAEQLLADMNRLLTAEDLKGVRELIEAHKIVCPISGTANWTEVRQFNLMFSTKIGSVSEEADVVYLRPETAQGIFVNFLNVQKTARMKVPFGIAQIGKAFRNEIVARQFIFRMREFEQMEMQFFVRPGEEMKWYEYWKEARMKWHLALGTPAEKLKFHNHDKLAHYANAAVDIEYQYPFGFKEVEGIHSRTDFDLKNHQEFSKKKQQYFDTEINQNYIPYVVETSIGADRAFLMVLSNAYTEETVGEGDDKKERTYLKLHPALAPIKAAIFPLVKKDGLPEKGRQIFDMLKYDFNLIYEEQQSIGKRYTRQDLIGTPFCIAVDYETMENDTVTIRHRDTMAQERVHISELKEKIGEAVSIKRIFEKLG